MHGDQVGARIFLVPGVLGLFEQLNTDQLVGTVGVIFQVPLDDVFELVAPDLQIGGGSWSINAIKPSGSAMFDSSIP